MVIPLPREDCLRVTHPCATLLRVAPFLVRLACVKRAANVRSEPGSNSPVKTVSMTLMTRKSSWALCSVIDSKSRRDPTIRDVVSDSVFKDRCGSGNTGAEKSTGKPGTVKEFRGPDTHRSRARPQLLRARCAGLVRGWRNVHVAWAASSMFRSACENHHKA